MATEIQQEAYEKIKEVEEKFGVNLPPQATVVKIDDDVVFIKAGWSDGSYPDAKKMRDATARTLRKRRFVVKSSSANFSSLGSGSRYGLEAHHPLYSFSYNGGWKKSRSEFDFSKDEE